MGSTPNVLAGAKKALENANNFTKSVTGGKPNAFAPKAESKPQAAKSDYSHARDARKSGGEFLGVRSDEAPDIKSGLESREAAKKALEQQ